METSTAIKNQIVGMTKAGMSIRSIAKLLNISKSTAAYWLKRFKDTGDVMRGTRSGRPKKTTTAEDEYIANELSNNPFSPVKRLANNMNVHAETVRRRLKKANFKCARPCKRPLLTPLHIEQRLAWAHSVERWYQPQWDAVLFSDESRFKVNFADGRIRIWRKKGERYDTKCIQQCDQYGGGSVMVWAGISSEYRTELVFLRQNVNSKVYIDNCLMPHVVPLMQNNRALQYFQHDNARPHAATTTQLYLDNAQVEVLKWPAKSPDMSPIEHL